MPVDNSSWNAKFYKNAFFKILICKNFKIWNIQIQGHSRAWIFFSQNSRTFKDFSSTLWTLIIVAELTADVWSSSEDHTGVLVGNSSAAHAQFVMQIMENYDVISVPTTSLTNRLRFDLVVEQLLYTVSPKKEATKLLPITFSNLNRFSKFFHCWIEDEYIQQNCIIFSTTP